MVAVLYGGSTVRGTLVLTAVVATIAVATAGTITACSRQALRVARDILGGTVVVVAGPQHGVIAATQRVRGRARRGCRQRVELARAPDNQRSRLHNGSVRGVRTVLEES